MSERGNCFGCGDPVPLRFFCTCGKRACIDRLGDNARPREIREWLIYQAGLRRAQELAKELSFEAYGEALHILAPELYEAIDAEVAKEGK
jgi:hypothetical protein